MRVRYHLSGKQAKDLSRGTVIAVAIPAPWHVCDAKAYFRDHVEIGSSEIKSAWEGEVTCNLLGGGGGDLAERFGSIVQSPESCGDKLPFTAQVAVIVAALRHPRKHEKGRQPTKWAGGYEVID
ncbi:hypothetical protein Pan216_20710 [Planctomycetes bacterium Pan216]|uniref:Uncharacterized protein n=1 Tax=Kolteria novifilia TaxID=2527975 RepID=A0A518B2K5_9BACT|nr:hypothetical protein Pan216_20710 [Planctomycetes bacterium Pan216]